LINSRLNVANSIQRVVQRTQAAHLLFSFLLFRQKKGSQRKARGWAARLPNINSFRCIKKTRQGIVFLLLAFSSPNLLVYFPPRLKQFLMQALHLLVGSQAAQPMPQDNSQ